MRSAAMLYHDVVDASNSHASGFSGADADHYKLSPAVFANHLVRFARYPSPRELVLTFDDAGASASHVIADMLEAHGMRGLFFVPTDYVGQKGFCTAADLRSLLERGHRLGSHSASHPVPISALSRTALLDEWVRSRTVLEQILGSHVGAASVPGGFTSAQVEETAEETGFTELYTSEPTREIRRLNAMAIHGRFSITRATNLETIDALASGSASPWVKQALFWNTKKVLKRLGGKHWLAARRKLFALNQR